MKYYVYLPFLHFETKRFSNFSVSLYFLCFSAKKAFVDSLIAFELRYSFSWLLQRLFFDGEFLILSLYPTLFVHISSLSNLLPLPFWVGCYFCSFWSYELGTAPLHLGWLLRDISFLSWLLRLFTTFRRRRLIVATCQHISTVRSILSFLYLILRSCI